MKQKQAFRIALSGVLVAVMLILGFIESKLPIGTIPGIKIGLSNGVLIFALYMMGIPSMFLLMVLKVTLSSLLFGFSAFPYALAGGLLSCTTMMLLSRIKGLKPMVVSMAGGIMHNVGQVALAMIIVKTPGLIGYMGILMLVGGACGTLTGLCATAVMKQMGRGKFRD